MDKRCLDQPVSRVEIHISCQNLLNKDVTSKSDPCCVLFVLDDSSNWIEHGRTEIIKNCLEPKFAKSFEIDYFFEQVQKIKFAVYDIDNASIKLSDDDFLGHLECTLAEVVSSGTFSRPLFIKGDKKKAGTSTISLSVNEISRAAEVLSLTFMAQNLDKKDFLGKSDPFLVISKSMPHGTFQITHRTEVVKNDLNPRWRPFDIKTTQLSSTGYDVPIKIECFDHDSDGSHDLIGFFTTTINELLKVANGNPVQWPCINPKKTSKKGYQNSGIIILSICKVTKDFSFLDYIFGGLQINFTVAIDFTASNGNPMDEGSLHFLNPTNPNQYVRAIQSVGSVIQDYDSDRLYPALGFGAKIPPNMAVSHEFAINFNPQNPFCAGVDGVLDAYMNCIKHVQLYGPTNFSPVIYHVAAFAANAQKENIAKNYYILLILTDGAITDVDETLQAIVHCSILPMSIIIVGVGDADFSTMNILDGDEGVLKDRAGNVARRDIVQFVPFREFKQAPLADLSKHVLAEIPNQVVGYFRINNINPSLPSQQQAEHQPSK